MPILDINNLILDINYLILDINNYIFTSFLTSENVIVDIKNEHCY